MNELRDFLEGVVAFLAIAVLVYLVWAVMP